MRVAIILAAACLLSPCNSKAKDGTGAASENSAVGAASVQGQPCYDILFAWGTEREAAHVCKGAPRDDLVVPGKEVLSLGAIECINKAGADNASKAAAAGVSYIVDSVAKLGAGAVCEIYR